MNSKIINKELNQDNKNKIINEYEGVSCEVLSEICAIFLCSYAIRTDPWRISTKITPAHSEYKKFKNKIVKLSKDSKCGFYKTNNDIILFYTKKAFVIFFAEQCGLFSKDSCHLPDFIKYGSEKIKQRFISGLNIHSYIENKTKTEMKAVYTRSITFAKDIQNLFNELAIETKIIYRKADGKRIKNDRYIVAFKK